MLPTISTERMDSILMGKRIRKYFNGVESNISWRKSNTYWIYYVSLNITYFRLFLNQSLRLFDYPHPLLL
jgi:hypothetical protein